MALAPGAMAGIDLRGDRELLRAMDDLPIKLENKVLKKALRTSINLYRSAARSAAPVRTGALKKSIKTYAIKRRGRNRDSIGFRVSTGSRKVLGIAPDAPGYYPTAIEYGWTDRHGNRHPPRSYMRSAWQSTKPRIESSVVTAIRSGLARVAKELAAGAKK